MSVSKKYLSLLLILLFPNFTKAGSSNIKVDGFGGYNFDIPDDNHNLDIFAQNDLKINNSAIQKFSAKQDWSEGIHTFDRSLGENFTLPSIKDDNHVSEIKTRNELIGDMIMETPLEYKIDKGDFTSGISLTPSIFIPNENSPIGNGNINVELRIRY